MRSHCVRKEVVHNSGLCISNRTAFIVIELINTETATVVVQPPRSKKICIWPKMKAHLESRFLEYTARQTLRETVHRESPTVRVVLNSTDLIR